jgi:hypothetical protein
MTRIGAFTQAVPSGQEVQGAFGQHGTLDETFADSSQHGESFRAFLANLSPAEEGAAPTNESANASGVQTPAAVTASAALAASRQTGQATQNAGDFSAPSAQFFAARADLGAAGSVTNPAAPTPAQQGAPSPGQQGAPTNAAAQLTDILDGFAQNAGGAARGGTAAPSTGQEPSDAHQANAPAAFSAKGIARQAGVFAQTATQASVATPTSATLQGLLGSTAPQSARTTPTNAPATSRPPASTVSQPRVNALAFLRAQAGLAGGTLSTGASLLPSNGASTPQVDPTPVLANGASAPTSPDPSAFVQAALRQSIAGETNTAGQQNGTPTPGSSTRSARAEANQSASNGSLRRSRGSADDGQDTTTSAGSSAPSLPLATPVITALANFAPAATFHSTPTSPQAATPHASAPAQSIAMPGAVAPTEVGTTPTDAATAALTEDAVTSSIKVSVVDAATHFAPVARLSPTQQISDAITASAASLLGAQTSSTSAQASAPTQGASTPTTSFDDALSDQAQPSSGSIKTLNLQLQPEALGQITIKLNLSDNGLAVQVEAVRPQTADLIDKDKQSLMQSLSQSGYAVTNLEVSVTPQHGSHLSGDAPPQQQGQADTNGGQAQGQSTGFGQSSNGGRSTHESAAFSDPNSGSQNLAGDAGASRNPRLSGDLFV